MGHRIWVRVSVRVAPRPWLLAPRPSPFALRPSPLAPRPSPLAPRHSPLAPLRVLTNSILTDVMTSILQHERWIKTLKDCVYKCEHNVEGCQVWARAESSGRAQQMILAGKARVRIGRARG